jgi:hypothetical protein
MPNVEELERQLAEARATQAAEAAASTQTNIQTFPNPAAPETTSPYAVTSWGSPFFDFKTPSGQLCQLKKVDVAELAQAGILDQVSRLPGVAGELIAKAEGQPPTVEPVLPDKDTIAAVVDLMNVLIPLVVVQPKIWPLPEGDETRKPDRIYADSVEIADRIAIMNRVLGGLQKLDSFRIES